MGNKPLTWQQVVMVLLCLPLFAGLVMAFGGNIPDDVRRTGGYVVAVTVPLLVAVTVWHFRAHHRPDLQPDILAKLVDLGAILQVGSGAHVWLSAGQDAGTMVLTCVLQNLVDATTSVDVSLQADKGGEFIGFVPTLSVVLPASGVARATLRVPVQRPGQPANVRLVIGASSRPGQGQRVRFARRQAVTKRVNPALTGALLLTGTIYAGGGTFLDVSVHPFEPAGKPAEPTRCEWEVTALWDVGDRADDRYLAQRLVA